MTEQSADILSNLISLGLMIYVFFALKRISTEQPLKKFGGLSIQSIMKLMYFGIAIFIIIMIVTLAG